MSADHKKFLSTKEAGQIVGRSSDYVAKLVREGRVSGKRIGRSWVVDEDSLRTHFDAHIAQVEVKKEKLSLERQAEYKAAQTPQKIIERSLVKIGNRLPISAEAFVGMTLSLLAVFGGYSLMHASGLAHLPTKLFESIHEVALSVNRNVAAVSHAPRSSKGSDYVATQDVPEKLSGSEAMIPAVSLIDDRYTYVAPQDVFAATYVPTRPELSFSPRSLVDGYVGIGVGISNLAHGSVGAYVSLVDSLGKEAFYSARIVWSLAQNVTDVLVGGYVGGVTTFASVAQSVPQAYEAFVYEFVDASFTVATTLGTAPYVIGDQIVTGASVVPSTANALGSGLRTNVPTFSENLGTGYVALIENFVFATYRLTDMYADAIEGAGSHIADVYFLVRFDIPAQAWMSAKGAYEVSVQYAKEEIHAAGAYIAQKTTIPVIVLVTNTSGDIREVAQEQVGVFEQKFEDSLSRVQLAQVEGATSFFSRVRSGIQNLFGGKSDPVLFVNPGPAQTDVVIREEAPAPQQPRNITQNFYASTDVSRNYVDSSIRALHEALTAQFQSLSQANRNQIVQNIETIQLINRIEDISDTIIRRPEILGGFLRDIEITGSSKFSGTRVRSDEFIGGTANFATTTLSNLTVNGDTTFTGTLTVGGLTTTGPLSAPYFTATSSTATSTFAGSFAIDTDGFVYATSTGNVGIGVLSPQALLSLRNATNTQAILTLSNAAGTEVGRFTDGGNFGIGTTSPYEKLSVDGNGVFTGSLAAATTTLSGRLTGTDAIFTNATITAATTTNFYSSVLRALSSTLTNLTATNATTTNATSTNFYTSVLNAITGSVTNLTATNATSTNLAISSLTSGRIPYVTTGGRLIDSSALTFDGTTVTATDLIATRATTTNATSTNLSVSGVLNLSGLTASRALFLDGGGNVVISGASSLLANSLTDETGTGSVVFSASPTLTGTATLANFIATNGTTTNATSTNLYVSGQTRLGSLTGLLKSTSGVVSAITSSAGLAGEISDETGSGSLVFADAPTLTSLTVSSGGIGVTGNSTIAGTLSSLTGLSSSGTITFSGLTANRLVATDGSSNLTNSISSANIAASITDETGTGSVVFSASPTLTGTATLANFIATNGTTTNATSTNLAVSSALRLPNLTASRLVALTAGGALTNSDIASWVAGTSNQITVADDGDGSITLSLPSQLSFTNFTATNGTTTNATSTNLAISSLTSGRIPYATTGGRLIDSSSLTFDGSTVTAPRFVASSASATSTFAGGLAVETSGLVYDYQTNRVGIGTASPSSKLHVYSGASGITAQAAADDFVIENSLAAGLSILSPDASTSNLYFGSASDNVGANIVWDYTSSLLRIGTSKSGGEIRFDYGNGNEAIRISSSGNVGIGTTTPGVKFQIATNDSDKLFLTGSSNPLDQLRLGFNHTSDYAYIRALESGVAVRPLILNETGGNIGIATTSPWAQLSVTNTGSGPSFVVEDATSPDSTPFIIDASGRIGIGTAAPGNKVSLLIDSDDGISLVRSGWGTASGIFLDDDDQGQNGLSIVGPSSRDITFSLNGNDSTDGFTVYTDPSNGSSADTFAFGVFNNGNVGIGTESPGQKLEVAGIIYSNAAIPGFRTTDTDTSQTWGLQGLGGSFGFVDITNSSAIPFIVEAGTPTDTLRLDNSGNVGIGTSTPDETLTIGSVAGNLNNQIAIDAAANRQAAITFRSAGVDKWYVGRGDSDQLSDSKFFIGEYEGNSTDAGGLNARLTIDSSGNVGIGTTAPGSRLSVSGGMSVGSSYASVAAPSNGAIIQGNVGIGSNAPISLLEIGGTTANSDALIILGEQTESSETFRPTIQQGSVLTPGTSNDLTLGTRSNTGGIVFFTGNNGVQTGALGQGTNQARMAITSTGYVGVGTTSPQTPLHVYTNNTAGTTGQIRLQQDGTGDVLQQFIIGSSGGFAIGLDNDDSDKFKVGYSSSGSPALTSNTALTIDKTGNVGIGTTTPAAKLDIYTTSTTKPGLFVEGGASGTTIAHFSRRNGATTDVKISGGGADPTITFGQNNTDRYSIGYEASGAYFSIASGGALGTNDRLVINSSGNVGIGTTTPAGKLTVEATSNNGLAVFNNTRYNSETYFTGLFKSGITNAAPDVRIVDADNNAARAALQIQGNGGATEVAFFGSNGRVGIGTVSPDAGLEISTPSSFSNGTNLLLDGGGTGGAVMDINRNSVTSWEALIKFSTAGTNVWEIGLDNDATEKFHIMDGSQNKFITIIDDGNVGDVGIATTSPSSRLHLGSGSIRVDRTTQTSFIGYGDQDGNSITNVGASDFYISGGDHNDFIIASRANSANEGIKFGNTSSGTFTPHMIIDGTTGNVGIGTTTPQRNLSISDRNANVNGTLFTQLTLATGQNLSSGTAGGGNLIGFEMFGGGISTGAVGGYMAGASNYGIGVWGGTNTGSPHLFVNNSGNIAIGTTTADAKLDLVGNGFPLIINSANSNGLKIKWEDNGTVAGYAGASTVLGHSFYVGDTNAAAQFVIRNSTGNVGIGTTGPEAELHIVEDTVGALTSLENSQLIVEDSGNAVITIVSGAASTGKLVFGDAANASDGGIEFDNSTGSLNLFTGNSQDRLSIDINGNVGIGTTTPVSDLHVIDTITGRAGAGYLIKQAFRNTGLYVESDNDLSVFNGGGRYITFEAGSAHTGIGTDNPSSLLDVAGTIEVSAAGATDPGIFGDASGTFIWSIGREINGMRLSSLDDFYFYTGASSNTTGTQRLVIDATTGNVGIGTSTPDARLTLLSTGTQQKLSYSESVYSTITTNSSGYLVIDSTGDRLGIGGTPVRALSIHNDVPFLEFRDTNQASSHLITSVVEFVSSDATRAGFFGINSQQFQINTDDRATDIPITFRTVDTERLRIGTDGRIGINDTSADYQLEVVGTSGNGFFGITNSSDGDIFEIDSNGNVGIGTNTPDAKLHIQTGTPASTDTNLEIGDPGDGSVRFLAINNARSAYKELRFFGVPVTFYGNGTENLRVHSNGFVGVGTTTPAYNLAVVSAADTNIFQLYDTDGNCLYNPESGSVTVSCSSDERLKSNIVDAQEGGLSYISDFRIRDYTVNASGDSLTGVIAQEVLTTRPEMVHMGEDGFYKVDQPNVWKLVQALQELDTRTSEITTVNGNIGIGTTTPAYKVHVLGDVAATSFVNISTREQKKGIAYFDESRKENILDKLETIKIAEYRYEYESDNNPLRLGLIAEEAPQEILAVGGKGVDIYKLATFTLASVQALATRVESLEERVAALEAQGMIPGQGGGVFSTTTLKSAFAELGILIEKGFAQFDKLAFRQLIAEKDTDGQAAAGTGTILAGNKLVLVENNQIKASSKVFITFTSPVVGSWFITDKANGSFRVTLAEVQGSDVTFDYFIVQTERPQTPTSNNGVVDTEAPTITLLGANPLYLALNTPFSDPGATVTDNVDQNLSYELFIDGYPAGEYEIDTSTKSEHVLTYKVLDTAGNLTTVTRGVFVGSEAALGSVQTGTTTPTTTGSTTLATTTPPVVEEEEVVEEVPADTIAPTITLSGKAAMKITVGSTFTDPGATATDDVDGDLTSSITVSGSVDTTKAGTYTLTYTVEDGAGNTGTASRVVTVQAQQTTGTSTPQQ